MSKITVDKRIMPAIIEMILYSGERGAFPGRSDAKGFSGERYRPFSINFSVKFNMASPFLKVTSSKVSG
ncbi:MAG: hypothetical protein WC902_11480, partial [Bacteroidales bacterium]